jgi:hypothetical protein
MIFYNLGIYKLPATSGVKTISSAGAKKCTDSRHPKSLNHLFISQRDKH